MRSSSIHFEPTPRRATQKTRSKLPSGGRRGFRLKISSCTARGSRAVAAVAALAGSSYAGRVTTTMGKTQAFGLARVFALALTLAASSALAQESEEDLACREPFRTAELVRVVIDQWDDWTVDSLIAFWPEPIEALDVGSTAEHLPTMYGRYVGPYGRCGEVFFFTQATRGSQQYLDHIELRYAAETVDDVELAGKAFLRAYGEPFEFLGDAYDEWRLDDTGHLRRQYRWPEPEMSVGITIESREPLFRLSMTYDRETWLDRSPPEAPEAPLRIFIGIPDSETFAPSLHTCLRGDTTPEILRQSSELARRIADELSRRPAWFEIVPETEADYVLIAGGRWGDRDRCISTEIPLPGQSLGLAIIEQGPDWRDLATLDGGARELAERVAARFREQYWRFRQSHR